MLQTESQFRLENVAGTLVISFHVAICSQVLIDRFLADIVRAGWRVMERGLTKAKTMLHMRLKLYEPHTVRVEVVYEADHAPTEDEIKRKFGAGCTVRVIETVPSR
jgi:hypothetical protein